MRRLSESKPRVEPQSFIFSNLEGEFLQKRPVKDKLLFKIKKNIIEEVEKQELLKEAEIKEQQKINLSLFNLQEEGRKSLRSIIQKVFPSSESSFAALKLKKIPESPRVLLYIKNLVAIARDFSEIENA